MGAAGTESRSEQLLSHGSLLRHPRSLQGLVSTAGVQERRLWLPDARRLISSWVFLLSPFESSSYPLLDLLLQLRVSTAPASFVTWMLKVSFDCIEFIVLPPQTPANSCFRPLVHFI
ncbi:hypothetical protein Mapa_004803 [Marchantia paleacea]|nr:hypothetical protein Mapa_004803 [Marchantia paleacea]